jgi:Cdc6-like AAA superfamily ATPase
MKKKPTQARIENAFLPAREIDDATRFAGRRQQVEATHHALLTIGSNIAIVGNRGIGKSSLARQLVAMASGKTELLDKLKIAHDDKHDFLTVYFACGSQTKSLDHLLQQLLTNDECLSRWAYYVPQAVKEMEAAPQLNVGFVKGELGSTATTESKAAILEHDLQTVFANVVNAIAKQGLAKNGVFIVVDEFDQLGHCEGFASFLKSLATNAPSVRFCIVGVGHDLQGLMNQHGSTDRLFAGGIIHLSPMSKSELMEIVMLAEQYIEDAIVFHVDARSYLADLAQGHPYMVHLIGKYALRAASVAGKEVISREDVAHTLQIIAERQADPILEGRYKKAVASSPQRESVLRAMAAETKEDGEVYTTDAYRIAQDQDHVENASQYVGNLVSESYGAELVYVRDRYYRFKDSLFRAYCLARPRQFKPY